MPVPGGCGRVNACYDFAVRCRTRHYAKATVWATTLQAYRCRYEGFTLRAYAAERSAPERRQQQLSNRLLPQRLKPEPKLTLRHLSLLTAAGDTAYAARVLLT